MFTNVDNGNTVIQARTERVVNSDGGMWRHCVLLVRVGLFVSLSSYEAKHASE